MPTSDEMDIEEIAAVLGDDTYAEVLLDKKWARRLLAEIRRARAERLVLSAEDINDLGWARRYIAERSPVFINNQHYVRAIVILDRLVARGAR